jgi:hypothetical protein
MSFRQILAIAAFMFAFLSSSDALAGVTINYAGTAKHKSAVSQAIATARRFALERGWAVKEANADVSDITRVVNEEEKPYHGPLKGILIIADPMCEPIYIQFGSDLFMQDYVKTQFAGPDVHIAVVQLFKALRPFFRNLQVDDEAEYWETSDRKKLEEHMATINRTVEALKKAHPGASGPVKEPSGRFTDVIQ